MKREYALDKRVENELCALAEKHGLKKLILFGSRARGTNGERSDIDLAASGGDVFGFSTDIEEEVWTLLSFDVVDLDRGISDELGEDIARDGVLIYEKI